ncbi:hypothetical protein JTE90_016568 [Oedothorax gibbosus]|uniref:Transposase n=1 Tax=Oedothorax gibbosus TaxID=931172 RepID=A0AAV6UCW2_9ARAC|nr:hypothetical protein JTE90_016568 [Oedothorax gibbosus]
MNDASRLSCIHEAQGPYHPETNPFQSSYEFCQEMLSCEMTVNDNESEPPVLTTLEPVKTSVKRKAEDDSGGTVTLLKKDKGLKGMKATELHAVLKKDPVAFCQEVGLLAKCVKCFCNADMRLEPLTTKKWWICKKNGHTKSQAIKRGTWFENSRTPFSDILFIMYMWLYRYPTGLMMHESNNTPKVIIGWNKKCLEACQLIMEMRNDPLGGEGKFVEVFDCTFKDKESGNWGFCALEQKSTKCLYAKIEDKTSTSIVQLLGNYILPGTTIISLFWAAYKNLSEQDFNYLIKEKRITFYHSTTKTKMDTYEEFVKGVNKHQPLTHIVNNEFDGGFLEKMYRKSLACAPDAYIAFLKDVSMVHKPVDVVIMTEDKHSDEQLLPDIL